MTAPTAPAGLSVADVLPAFPNNGAYGHTGDYLPEAGMTLRDWFAGQALAGLAANHGFIATASWDAAPNAIVTSRAFAFADAMLVARSAAEAARAQVVS